MSKRKTNEQFVKEIFDLVGNEYTFLEEYKKAKTKIKIRHNKCGNIYKVQPSSFLKGNRCPKCSGKKTQEEFKQQVVDLVGDEYSVLGEYKGGHTKIKIKHNKCGHVYYVTPASFLQGNRCPICKNLNRTKTTEQFKKEVFDLVGNEYEVLGEYKKSLTKIKVIHNACGNEYYVKPNDFLNGSRCPKCSRKKTNEQFVKEVFDIVKEEYTVLGEYKGSLNKIKVIHNKCGHIYEVTPSSFLQGKRCPYCKASKGERKIADFLIKNKIKFETQKEFGGLVHIRPLKFDFYLPDRNLLIEYDGHHHFKPVRFNGISEEVADENFKNQQIRDKMKNDYCKEHNIELLRIKYTDFDKIRKILKENISIPKSINALVNL